MYRLLKKGIIFIISFCCMMQMASPVYAANSNKQYLSDVVLSYGNTDDEAKKWLTKNGYKIIDCNINEGADDAAATVVGFSNARSVYVGYKTTIDASKAITDLKLMNMKGKYSAQDYQAILEAKKSDINSFMKRFISTLQEYRVNYNNKDERAIAAHDTLNMLYDDDTDMDLGDLLLNKIKEEYTEEAYNKLSIREKQKHADMTTILMQGDSQLVLTIEQTLATATDTNNNLWLDRVSSALSYDAMYDELYDQDYTDKEINKLLSQKYDETASVLVTTVADMKDWFEAYEESNVKLTSSEDKLNTYLNKFETDDEKALWLTKASEYEALSDTVLYKGTKKEITLLDLFKKYKYDFSEKKEELYPIASVLTEGQKGCLDSLSAHQFISLGLSTGSEEKTAVKKAGINELEGSTSIYNGIDRSIYNEDVALTDSALAYQTTTKDVDYSNGWFKGSLSTTNEVLAAATAVSVAAAIGS